MAGDYFLIVKAGRSFALNDINAANNIAVSTALTVTVPQLVLGTPLVDALTSSGQARYYRIDLEAGAQLRLKLNSAANDVQTELYLRRDALPAPGAFLAQAESPAGPDRELLFPVLETGTSYVQASSALFPPGTDSSFTTEVHSSEPLGSGQSTPRPATVAVPPPLAFAVQVLLHAAGRTGQRSGLDSRRCLP